MCNLHKDPSGQFWYETIVKDEGPGIEGCRIGSLFKVFGELSRKQSMRCVKHNSIGVGLNCSKIIAEFLGGKVEFLSSQPGDT